MMPCHTRRRVLNTLAAVSIAGTGILPTAQANPLVWVLRTLITLGLTRRQAWAMAQQSSRAIAHRPATQSATGVVTGMAARHAAFNVGQDVLSDSLQKNNTTDQTGENTGLRHAQNERHDDLIDTMEVWDIDKQQSLFLKIPPGNQFVSDVLEVVMTSVQSGRQRLINRQTLAILPSTDEVVLKVPLGVLDSPGRYRFAARIPALADKLIIQSTAPVLIR